MFQFLHHLWRQFSGRKPNRTPHLASPRLRVRLLAHPIGHYCAWSHAMSKLGLSVGPVNTLAISLFSIIKNKKLFQFLQ